MGDRVPGPLCGEKVGRDWIDGGTLCRSRSFPPGPTKWRPTSQDLKRRKRATALKAADARTIVEAKLPLVLKHMSDEQVEQMQKVLDAAVVNPDVEKQANDLYRRSIIAQSGSLVNRDERMVRRAYREMESFIAVKEADKRVRLDYKALLTAEALNPTTDNPDEAAYLETVRQTLASRGVWLRYGPKLVRDPEDPSRHIYDHRTFEVWLSLGPDGDEIPTDNGRLTRDILLKTTVLGAGYWQRVHQGGVQSALEKEIRRLTSQIKYGLMQHQMLAKIRRDAFVGVAEISDLLGGADFPDQSIWDTPHKLVLRALELNVGGNVSGSQVFLLVAAVVTRNAARQLATYIDDSSSGAERAVAVLKVAKTAGQVAEAGLALTGAVGLVRGSVSVFAGEGAATASEVAFDAAVKRGIDRYAARSGTNAAELAEVRFVPQPRGSVAGGVTPGTSSGAGRGWDKWP